MPPNMTSLSNYSLSRYTVGKHQYYRITNECCYLNGLGFTALLLNETYVKCSSIQVILITIITPLLTMMTVQECLG